jgi:hypothetical protein
MQRQNSGVQNHNDSAFSIQSSSQKRKCDEYLSQMDAQSRHSQSSLILGTNNVKNITDGNPMHVIQCGELTD